MGETRPPHFNGILNMTVGQWLAGLFFNQGVGDSIPALVDVLSKTLNPEFLPEAVSTV